MQVSGITANTKVTDIAAVDIELTGALSGATTIGVVQKAQPLGLNTEAPAVTTASTSHALKRKVLGDATWSAENTNCPVLSGYTSSSTVNYIRVWRNGAELTYNASPSGAAQFKFENTSGTVTFGQTTVAGDIIKVTIQPGANLPEETISFTVTATTP